MYTIPRKLGSKQLSDYKKKKLTKEIKNYRSVSDVVAYLLANLTKPKMTADDEVIHNAFRRLKEEHPQLLVDMTFSAGDIFPFSEELQTSLFNLQSSGIMEAINPVYETYRIPKTAKDTIITHLSDCFSVPEKHELREMSRRLGELLSSNGTE